jgi:hypothetical protein
VALLSYTTLRDTISGGSSKPGICAINRMDLATIQRLCFQLALATNTKDYQVAIELGDGGLLPALATYAEKPSDSSWRRVRNEALVFINTTQQLLTELGKSGGAVDALDPDQRARVLSEVRNALRVVNEAVWTIHYAGGEPDDPSLREDGAPLRGSRVHCGGHERQARRRAHWATSRTSRTHPTRLPNGRS